MMDRSTVKKHGWLYSRNSMTVHERLCVLSIRKMNHTKMTPGQDPDEFLYIMESCRDRPNMSTPPESPTDRQYEDIVQQVSSVNYESI